MSVAGMFQVCPAPSVGSLPAIGYKDLDEDEEKVGHAPYLSQLEFAARLISLG